MKTINEFIIEKLRINKDIETNEYSDDVYDYIEELAYRWTADHEDKEAIEDFIKSKEEPEWDLLISGLQEEYIDIKKDYKQFDKEVVDDTLSLFRLIIKYPQKIKVNDELKKALIQGMTKYAIENY